MTTKKTTGTNSYEIVKTFSDGSELRRYTFYDGSVHSVIFEDGFIVEAVPIEKEDDMVAWWETEIEAFERGRTMVTAQMTFNEYQELARRTQNAELDMDEKRLHALYGLASEVGEIHGLFQKVYQGHPLNLDDLEDELGDLLWFAAELCDAHCWQMGDVAAKNIEKLKKRYPEGFDADRSVHREAYGDDC